jgi:hypothetical protein
MNTTPEWEGMGERVCERKGEKGREREGKRE